ncbi:MAG: DUF1905 domain-containing protein [Flavobacteriales bacterium]|nr:DUF1905 domain-containing protein [Flavobacteriales bacterium]
MTDFTGPVEVFENNLYEFHVKVPLQIAEPFCKGKDRRVIATYNGLVEKPCALMPHPTGYFLMLNKDLRSKLRVEPGDLIRVSLRKDESEFGYPIPEEFNAALEQDERARDHFLRLSPGKQRSLIYLVDKLKNSEKRIEKSLAILHHLNEVNGQLDFKKLNETFKIFNRDMNL